MNLVTNAAEAMPDGGTITIALNSVSVPKDLPEPEGLAPGIYVKLTVSDSGKGIAAEVMDRIYEPFFTTKKMGLSGTGLGMAVVWGTVEDHNGHINVQSHPQRGTIFELWFPAECSCTEDQSVAPVEVPEGDKEKILVVDDIPEQREIAAAMLGRLNYQVRTLSSGEEAVSYLQEHSADLVLLDMTMDPGINGLETYRRILQFKPHQRAVIASGFSDTDLVHDVLQMGAQCYLKKPYSFEALSNAVRKALQQ
jgi:CheY-like chemotaxis protein